MTLPFDVLCVLFQHRLLVEPNPQAVFTNMRTLGVQGKKIADSCLVLQTLVDLIGDHDGNNLRQLYHQWKKANYVAGLEFICHKYRDKQGYTLLHHFVDRKRPSLERMSFEILCALAMNSIYNQLRQFLENNPDLGADSPVGTAFDIARRHNDLVMLQILQDRQK